MSNEVMYGLLILGIISVLVCWKIEQVQERKRLERFKKLFKRG